MHTFPETLLKHLGRYRLDVLKIKEPGVFRHQDNEHFKEHVLPIKDKYLNFLPLIRDIAPNLADAKGRAIKWHRYAHHLNSSQILAVNLFQPLLLAGEEGQQILSEVAGTNFPSQNNTGFEFVPNEAEGTNIDFCVTGSDGGAVFMELKLTESEFGGAADDQKHREKFQNVYLEACKGKLNLPSGKEWETFRQFYQVFRNVVYADARTKVWFVIPGPHKSLRKRAELALSYVDTAIQSQIEVVNLGDLFRQIQERVSQNQMLAVHYAEFKEKYLPALE